MGHQPGGGSGVLLWLDTSDEVEPHKQERQEIMVQITGCA